MKKINVKDNLSFYLEHSNCISSDVKMIEHKCEFIVDEKRLKQIINENSFYFIPKYLNKEIPNEIKSSSNASNLKETKLDSLKDLKNYFNNPNNGKSKMKKILINEGTKLFLSSIPSNVSFFVSTHKGIALNARFSDNVVCVLKDGSMRRNINIITNYRENLNKAEKKAKKNKRKEIVERIKNTDHSRTFISSKTEEEFEHKLHHPKNQYKKENPKFEDLGERSDRIKLTNARSTNVFSLFDKSNAIKEIQLIKSANNHVTKNHRIENKIVELIYYLPKEKQYTNIEMLVHYCVDCGVYFDFYDSFIEQLKVNKVDTKLLLLNYIDENKNKILLGNMKLHEYSLLKLFGYEVGENGLSYYKRQELIKRLIIEKYMTPTEIKSFLQYLIGFNGKRGNMEYSKKCWEEDMQFINDFLTKIKKERTCQH